MTPNRLLSNCPGLAFHGPVKLSFAMPAQNPATTELNALPQDEFVRLVGPVFEHSSWISEETWPRRPFANLTALHSALCGTVREAGEPKQLALIRAHPDLVGRAALAGTLTPTSSAEQASAGLNQLNPDEIVAFLKFNRAYRDRFGFPFIICARLNKKETILKAFPIRLQHSREQEITTALDEIYKIAYLRLKDIVAE